VSEFIQIVDEFITRQGLIGAREAILVGVSGGLDSRVLLEVLQKLATRHGWGLIVAHFNHQLRGRSAEADERFVQEAARKLGLRFIAGRSNVRQFARKKKLSIEMAARQLRHEFLARTALKEKIRTIALAHHAGDQVELFFLRTLRGAGPEGLSGMRAKSPSPVEPRLRIIRPLLNFPREEIRAFAAERKIRFREDASNATLDYLRNRIRHELIPLLQKHYQQALPQTTVRLMDILGAENDFIAKCARNWIDAKTRPPFDSLPVALQRRCLQAQIHQLGLPADFTLVEQLRTRPGIPVTVSPVLFVIRDTLGLLKTGKKGETNFNLEEKRVDLLDTCGMVLFGGLKIAWKRLVVEGKTTRLPRVQKGREIFDAEHIGDAIQLRHWREGDRFQPIGMPAQVKLQDLFTNLKVPRAERHQRVVATNAEGEIFWVEGLRIGERCKVRKRTARLLLWHWERR